MTFGRAQKIFPRNFLSTIFLGKVHHEISHENANQVIGFWHSALIFPLSFPLEMRNFIERDRQMFGFELFYHSKMNKTAVVELHRVSVVRIISWNFHESSYKKFLSFYRLGKIFRCAISTCWTIRETPIESETRTGQCVDKKVLKITAES